MGVEHSLAMKTVKAGTLARSLSVFRVDYVIVYSDDETRPSDARLLSLILSYAETPPHLRKRLYPLMRELRYAGLIPPLRTPSHEPPDKPVAEALVEGIVVERRGGLCRVDLGLLGVWTVPSCRWRPGSRVVVRLSDPDSKTAEPASWGNIYSGYSVLRLSDLASVVEWGRRRRLALVATSRLGSCPSRRILCKLASDAERRGILILFGGPRGSLVDQGFRYDYTINVVPGQGTLTVRTEEAVQAGLALINAVLEAGWC